MDDKSFPVFAGLTDFERQMFVAACKRIEVRDDYRLIVEGGVLDRLYFVYEGGVRVHLETPVGEQELAFMAAPCLVGELELLLGEEDCVAPATVTTIEASKAFVMPFAAFKQRLAGGDLASYKIVHNIARLLAERLRATNQRVREMAR